MFINLIDNKTSNPRLILHADDDKAEVSTISLVSNKNVKRRPLQGRTRRRAGTTGQLDESECEVDRPRTAIIELTSRKKNKKQSQRTKPYDASKKLKKIKKRIKPAAKKRVTKKCPKKATKQLPRKRTRAITVN